MNFLFYSKTSNESYDLVCSGKHIFWGERAKVSRQKFLMTKSTQKRKKVESSRKLVGKMEIHLKNVFHLSQCENGCWIPHGSTCHSLFIFSHLIIHAGFMHMISTLKFVFVVIKSIKALFWPVILFITSFFHFPVVLKLFGYDAVFTRTQLRPFLCIML